MAWPCDVIPQDRGRERTKKNRAGSFDPAADLPSLACHHLAVLRCELVGQRDCLVERFQPDEPAIVVEGALDELAPRQLRQLACDLLFNRLEHLAGRRDQPKPLMAGTMLGLGQQIGGNKLRIGRFVRQNQEFTRTRKQIYRYVPEHQSFGGNNVNVPRPKDFLHAPDRLRSESHGRDGLGAAHSINLRRARPPRCKQQSRVYTAILAARCTHHDFRTASHMRQRYRHQSSGNQRGCAAGNINADALERIESLPNRRAVGVPHLPCLAPRFLRKRGDIFVRLGDRHAQALVGLERRGHQLGLRHRELLRGQPRAIEPLGQLQQGRIVPRLHRLKNRPRALFDLRIEQAGGRGELPQAFGEIGVRVTGHVHGPRG